MGTIALAQVIVAGWSLLQILVIVIVVAAAIAIVSIGLARMGVAVPPWAIQIGWILLVAFVVILALVILFRVIGSMS